MLKWLKTCGTITANSEPRCSVHTNSFIFYGTMTTKRYLKETMTPKKQKQYRIPCKIEGCTTSRRVGGLCAKHMGTEKCNVPGCRLLSKVTASDDHWGPQGGRCNRHVTSKVECGTGSCASIVPAWRIYCSKHMRKVPVDPEKKKSRKKVEVTTMKKVKVTTMKKVTKDNKSARKRQKVTVATAHVKLIKI